LAKDGHGQAKYVKGNKERKKMCKKNRKRKVSGN
jgi:hypothetical protein